MMVAGADRLCTVLSKGKQTLKVTVCTSTYNTEFAQWRVSMMKSSSTLFGGAFYNTKDNNNKFIGEIWLCPVTLFVLGKYPDRLLIL